MQSSPHDPSVNRLRIEAVNQNTFNPDTPLSNLGADPAVTREVNPARAQLQQHLNTAYYFFGADSITDYQKFAVKAFRIALTLPDQSDALVGESYLLAATVCNHRAARFYFPQPSSEWAIELLHKANQVYAQNNWDEPTYRARHELLLHQASCNTLKMRDDNKLTEVELLQDIFKQNTNNPTAINHIFSLALAQVGTSQLGESSALRYSIMKNLLNFAERNRESSANTERPLIMQAYECFGKAVAQSHNAFGSDISDEKKADAINKGIVFLERANRLNDRGNLLQNSESYARLQSLRLSLHLHAEELSLDADEAEFVLRKWMTETDELVSPASINNWVALEAKYLKRKIAFLDQSISSNERQFLSDKYSEAYAPILLRALELFERLPAYLTVGEPLGDIRFDAALHLLKISRPTEALEILNSFETPENALLSEQQSLIIGNKVRACIESGAYLEADRLTEIVLRNLTMYDPENIFRVSNTVSKLSLGCERIEIDPVGAARIMESTLKELGSLDQQNLTWALRSMAWNSLLLGRNQDAQEWVAILNEKMDFGEPIDDQEAQFDGEDEVEDPIEWEASSTAAAGTNVLGLAEANLRAMILLSNENIPVEQIEALIELIRSFRTEDPSFAHIDSALASDCFSAEGLYSLVKGDYESAHELFAQALKRLSMDRHPERFYFANNLVRDGIALSRLERFEQANDSLSFALSIYEEFLSPNSYTLQACKMLSDNYQALGMPNEQRKFDLRLIEVVKQLERAPRLTPILIPITQSTEDEF